MKNKLFTPIKSETIPIKYRTLDSLVKYMNKLYILYPLIYAMTIKMYSKSGTIFSKKQRHHRHKYVMGFVNGLKSEYNYRKNRNEWSDDVTKYMAHVSKFDSLESLLGENYIGGNHSEILVDGPASFEKRYEMLDAAKESVHMMVWGIYNDESGLDFTRRILEKIKQGVKVYMLVDGRTCGVYSTTNTLRLIEKAGGQVIYYDDRNETVNGMHMKVFITDHQYCVMGGINVGNYYTHQYGVPEDKKVESAKWRDTDVFLSGPIVGSMMQKFQSFWNSQINDNQLSTPLLNYYIDPTNYSAKGNSQIICTMMKPGAEDISILYSIMFLICHAKKSIDIENAYVIEVPGFHEAIEQAIQRGVRVRIFTNSQFSIDEAIIFDSVSLYLKKLYDAGAEIYLKRGSDTLHSKFLIADNEIVNIGSMNLHPRSLYIEWEANCTINDVDTARNFTEVFERDIEDSKAFRLLSKEQLPDLSNLSSKFMKYFFYRNL